MLAIIEKVLYKLKEVRIINAIHNYASTLLTILFGLSLLMIFQNVSTSFMGVSWMQGWEPKTILNGFMALLPFLTVISVGYYCAQAYKFETIHIIMMSLCLWTGIIYQSHLDFQVYLKIETLAGAIVLPVVSVLIYQGIERINSYLFKRTCKQIPTSIISSLKSILNLCFGLLVVFLIVIVIKAVGIDVITSMHRILFDGVFKLYQYPIVFLIFVFMMQHFWYQGMHGDALISALFEPAIILATLFNMHAHANGYEARFIINATFYTNFVAVSGAGLTGGLLLSYYLVRKEKRIDVLDNAGVSSVFNINEPLIFGIPIIMNGDFKMAFIIAPLVASTLAYFLTSIGLMKPYIYAVPWFIPFGIKGLIGTGGDLKTLLFEIILAIIVICIYLPATKKYVRNYKQQGELDGKSNL